MDHHLKLDLAQRIASAQVDLQKVAKDAEKTVDVRKYITAAISELEKAQEKADLQLGQAYRQHQEHERPPAECEAA